jgi:ribonucleoside-diphosphate reductase alpha chain
MDCDTTGVEPDIALVKYKILAGGGNLKIVNQTVPEALTKLGYQQDEIKRIVDHIAAYDTIEDVTLTKDDAVVKSNARQEGDVAASGLKPAHLPVFDCAFKAYRGKRSISYMAHLKMMGAAQPFISGAISKTVNLPHECSVDDIKDAYVQAWKMGLKCVAIYRDGSKRSQPLNTKRTNESGGNNTVDQRIQELEGELTRLRAQTGQPLRRRLPDTRTAITHKFEIAGHEGYLTVGLFEDGQPGELFITMAKEGSTIGGLMDCIGTLTSLALQYGVPLEALMRKFAHQRFEPSGFTKNPEIRNASSIIDYVFRWLALQFIPGYRETAAGLRNQPELTMPGLMDEVKKKVNRPVSDLPLSDDTDILIQATPAAVGNGNGHASSNGNSNSNGTGASELVKTVTTRAVTTLNESVAHFQLDAPTCPNCGHVAVRNGACYKCLNCGESLGCS